MSEQTTKEKIRSAYQWGKDHNSCALEWRRTLGPDATQADAYRLCKRGDWLIWQLSKLTEDEFNSIRPQLEEAIEKIITRAVKNHALNCGIDLVEKWARDWLDNIDRSEGAARKAEWAARASAERVEAAAEWAARKATERAAASASASAASEWAAAAEWASASEWASEWATERAAAAEWASVARKAEWAAKAARATENKLQADDIREFIPQWPGSC